jgi:hypothetical protein
MSGVSKVSSHSVRLSNKLFPAAKRQFLVVYYDTETKERFFAVSSLCLSMGTTATYPKRCAAYVSPAPIVSGLRMREVVYAKDLRHFFAAYDRDDVEEELAAARANYLLYDDEKEEEESSSSAMPIRKRPAATKEEGGADDWFMKAQQQLLEESKAIYAKQRDEALEEFKANLREFEKQLKLQKLAQSLVPAPGSLKFDTSIPDSFLKQLK